MSEISIREALLRGVNAHKAGKLREADKYYTAILAISPDHVDANHNLGLIASSLGKFRASLPYLEKAVKLQPMNPQFWESYVKSLIGLEKYDIAYACITKAQTLHPGVKTLGNLLDLIKTKSSNHDIKNAINDLVKIYYEGKFEVVLDDVKSLLIAQPRSVVLLNIMGSSLSALKLFDKAIEVYERALVIQPNNPDVNNNFGNALRRSGDLLGSLDKFDVALNNREKFFDAHLNKGHALFDLAKLDSAIASYRMALKINPHSEEALLRIGNAYKKQGKIEAASKSYQSLLSMNPKHDVANHLYSSLNGQHTKKAPRKYVEALFDHYAKKFEQSLVDDLNYKIPEKLINLMERVGLTKQKYSVLDIGCGTGLFGSKIKSYCKVLHGVDLSIEMLDVARQKGIYDNLEHNDILEYLEKIPRTYDFFVATDVFIYLGDLDKIFNLIKNNNPKGGHLLFSTEHLETGDYKLETSARYSHSKTYIEKLCAKYNYQLKSFKLTDLRKETREYIKGALYILSF